MKDKLDLLIIRERREKSQMSPFAFNLSDRQSKSELLIALCYDGLLLDDLEQARVTGRERPELLQISCVTPASERRFSPLLLAVFTRFATDSLTTNLFKGMFCAIA